MAVVTVIAVVSCDWCGCEMQFDMDRGRDIPEGWDLDDLATDAVRGGDLKRINKELCTMDVGSTSVQDGQELCPKCTKSLDMQSVEGGA